MNKFYVMALATLCLLTAPVTQAALPPIPPPLRDYRCAWCATVTNIDWPPSAGVSASIVDAQKARLLAHINGLADAKMNAMYFQARPACDAMYNSTIEPPSQWLTGSQNTAATWDPLAFAVTECHNRGIEVHAWVNPYRAALDQVTTNKAPNHVMRAHPDYCKAYAGDGRTYLDPGKPEVIAYIKSVIADMVTRYDIDGVVFDDYFYPGSDFNDADTYAVYTGGGGSMTIDDWRRDNVNKLIQGCYTMIHGIRQSCQFEVGPFGIWRPGYPTGITGADYYATHYCDTRLWLQNGWVDSLSPQLYWALNSTGQPFGPLIDWWVQQNPARHVMASTADYRVGTSSWPGSTNAEIVNQVYRTYQAGGVGDVHYSIKFLTDDTNQQRTALKAGPYALDALRPASTWLDNVPPPPPIASLSPPSGVPAKRTLSLAQNPGDEAATWWCVYTNDGTTWTLKVLPGATTSLQVNDGLLGYAVSAVDRFGNESARQIPTSSLGTVRLDRSIYKPGDTVHVNLFDGDLIGSGSVVLAIGSTSEPTGEEVALTETGPGVFDGSITLAAGPAVAGDGLLQVADMDSIVVFYHDADNGSGQPADITATAAVDAAVPVISNVQISGITGTTAQVSFDVSEPTTAVLHLGTSCGSFTRDVALANTTTSHAVTLTGLNVATTHYFSLQARDAAGNDTTNDNSGSCFSFTTTSYPGVPFYDGFESGTIGSAWTITGTGSYRTSATSSYAPYAGTYQMLMETTSAAYALNQATLTLDLASAEDVVLSFEAKGFSDESNAPPSAPFTNAANFDGVSISADGVNWYEVQALRNATADTDVHKTFNNFYAPFTVDLDSAVAGLGLAYNSSFKIRFNQYDNELMPSDGIAVDEVYVGGVTKMDMKVSPVADFVTSGPLGGPWWPVSSPYTVTNSGSQPMDWAVSADQTWVTLSPASGHLEPGEQVVVAIGIANGASDFELGTYNSIVTFTDTTSGKSKQRKVTLVPGTPDWLTQTVNSSTPIDNTMFTFKPDGLQSSYSVCRTTTAQLPSTTAGTTLSSRDDTSWGCNLTGGKTIPFFGKSYSSFYIGSNGYVTFTAGDSDYSPTIGDHFRLPRISAMFNDLYPGKNSGGRVTWSQQTDRVVVSFNAVPHAHATALSTFQIEMFFDGTIRITYLGLNKEGIMGLSAGQGVPPNFYESVFGSYKSCNMPSTAPELSGSAISQTRIGLSWTDLDNETTYVIERKQGGADFAPLAMLRMNRVTYLDTDVTTFTEYVYRVYGFNVWGQSDYSNEVTVRTPDNPPAAPGWLGATVISQTQIDLTWGDDADNETTYVVKRHTEGLPFSVIAVLPPDSATYSDTDVSTNTTYYYQVDAENSGGVAGSEEVSATTLPEPPSAPSNFSVTGVSQTQISLQWIDTSSNESEFQLERKAPGDPDFALIAHLPPDTQTYDDPGLVANSTYAYRIRAINTGGISAYADELTTRTLPEPPPAPTQLVATVLGQTSIKLDWTDVSQNEDGYLIQRTGPGATGPAVTVVTLGANAITYTDSGLQSDSDYTYTVTAYNTGGRNGAQAAAHTLPYPPSAPSNFGVTGVSQTQIGLHWTDTSSNESEFQLERKAPSDPGFALIAHLPPDTQTYDDSGLVANSTYVYRIRAINTGGNSAYADELTTRTLPQPPPAPTQLLATVLGQTSIKLDWTDVSQNEDGYLIQRTGPGTAGPAVTVATLGANATTYTDSGLQSDSDYTYSVTAFNTGGQNGAQAMAHTLPYPPSAPTGLGGVPTGQTSVQLTWVDLSDNEASFEIERLSVDKYAPLGSAPKNSSSYDDSGLAPDTEYVYRVRAVNSGGASAYTPEFTVRTLPYPPSAPAGLSAAVLGQTEIALTWSDTSSNEDQIVLERQTPGGNFEALQTFPPDTTSFTDSGLTPDTTYVYRVKTSNRGGQSAWCLSAEATTLKVPPTAPTITGVTALSVSSLQVAWDASGSGATSICVERFDVDAIDFVEVAVVDATDLSHVDTSLLPDATYTYRVRGWNNGGYSPYSSEVSGHTVNDVLPGTLKRVVQNPVPRSNDKFGWSVAVFRDTAVIGAPLADLGAKDAGAVYVYDLKTSAPPVVIHNPEPGQGDQFGWSVATDGNRVVVGAPWDDAGGKDAGSAYLFTVDGTLVGRLSNPNPAQYDHFGWSVAVEGITKSTQVIAPKESDGLSNRKLTRLIAVGAPGKDTAAKDAGSVYLFDGTTLTRTVTSPSPVVGGLFGWSVDVAAGQLGVGSPNDSTNAGNAGAAFIFSGPDMGTYRSYLGSGARDLFGFSVRFSDANQLLAGAPADEQSASNFNTGNPPVTAAKKPTKKKPVQDCGLAYLLSGDIVKLLTNPVPARTDKFGFACATGSRTNVVGAPYDDAGASDAGSVFLYCKGSDEMVCIPNPSPAASDWFGWSVAAWSNVILVGAPCDDTGARNAGCVYIYAGYGN